jgi:hypothetical protein
VHQQLGAAPQRLVGNGVHVADDHVGCVARVEQRVGAAVHGDQHGLEVPDVRTDHPQVALVAGAARDDERMAVAEAGLEVRELDALGEELPLLAQIPHRVVGECLERLCYAPALLREHLLELGGLEDVARHEARTVPVDPCAAHGQQLALTHLVEQLGAGRVDEAHAAADERERARVREAAGLGGGDIDDDAHAGLDELLRRDAVDVRVVDDGDVVRGQPLDEVLRPPVELRVAGVLDEAHGACTADRNLSPPSIRCSSSRRSLSASCSMRVCVGSPGIFSTRK